MKKNFLAFLLLIFSVLLVACENNDEKMFVVDFDTDGGRYIASQNVFDGDLVEEPETPFKNGYIFDDWYKDSNYSDKWLFDQFIITEDTTIYAKFHLEEVPGINYYDVTFLLGNDNVYLSKTIEEGNLVSEPNEPTKINFTFKGW